MINASVHSGHSSHSSFDRVAGTPPSHAAVLAMKLQAPGELSEAIVRLHEADSRRSGPGRSSGYVQAGGEHFHVAKTSEGPLVSVVQWQRTAGQGLKPVHDMFRVRADQKALAIKAWDVKLASEKEKLSVSNSVAVTPSALVSNPEGHDEAASVKIKNGGAGRMR